MKTGKKNKAAVMLLCAALGMTLFAAFGCGKLPSGGITEAILQRHPADGDAYSFRLTLTDDGRLLFSASADDGGSRIEFEEFEVPAAWLDEFRAMAKDTGLEAAVWAKFKGSDGDKADDGTPGWTATMRWENGVTRTSDARPLKEPEIRTWLTRCAKAFSDAREPTGELEALSLYATSPSIEGNYHFDVTEEGGDYFLSAGFEEPAYDEANGWHELSVELEHEPLTAAQMETIRSAAREDGLWEALGGGDALRYARWAASGTGADTGEGDLIPDDADTYYLSARWNTKTSLSESGWGGHGLNTLRDVLKQTAKAIANPDEGGQ